MAVYKRGKSWYIDIRIGGVRIHRKAADTKSEAKRIEEELKTKWRLKKLHASEIKDEPVPFEVVTEMYLDYCSKVKAKKTNELERISINKHILPFFQNKYINDITTEDLIEYQGLKKNQGLSNRTVNIHISIVRKIINFAVDKGIIVRSSIKKYPMLKEPKKQHAFLTPSEVKALIDNITCALTKKRVLFGVLTGMRPAELAYLAWNDVDFYTKTVKVQGKAGWKPKTSEERIIPLCEDAINILKELYKNRKSQWVFSNTDKPVISIKKSLRAAAKKAGIQKRVSPNMIRHTFATTALLAGASIMEVKEVMGHSQIKTTARYLHALQEHLKKAVEKVSDLLKTSGFCKSLF
ncbi:tyrosine-type recombinase/integrase [Thermodesulfovibrio sp. TK110]